MIQDLMPLIILIVVLALVGAIFLLITKNEFIRGMLSETDKSPSSSRFNVFYFGTLLGMAMTYGLIWVVVKQPDLTLGYLGIVAALLTALFGIGTKRKQIEVDGEVAELMTDVELTDKGKEKLALLKSDLKKTPEVKNKIEVLEKAL